MQKARNGWLAREIKKGDECGDLEAEIHGEESEDGDNDEGERRERRLVCEVFENAENEEDAEIRNNPTESMLPFGRVGARADPTVGTRPDGRRMMTGGLEDAHPTASIQSARRSDQLTHGLDPTCFEWDTIGPVEDMSHGCGITLFKVKPLEALWSPRRDLITLLSHL
ncbi:hypothetical protein OIU74_016663 [Salix koriyanagi]|uniref:Uncharacterized protein n=1 Tax=Salix koriyanagi TaxID=2511006 RepID=A0A9Q0PGY5_9ROSI|nr:hypothetical protein OIU74_016663 [Salix koriyanagi]